MTERFDHEWYWKEKPWRPIRGRLSDDHVAPCCPAGEGGIDMNQVERERFWEDPEPFVNALEQESRMLIQEINAVYDEDCAAYKGVTWHKGVGKWQAVIALNRERFYLGVFVEERDAALVYDARARELFGEFAYVNFPDEEPV